MLAGIVMFICVVVWLAIQKNLADQGYEPLTRGQSRYMRKKARRQGVDVSEVSYRPRKNMNPYDFDKRSTAPGSRDAEIEKVVRKYERDAKKAVTFKPYKPARDPFKAPRRRK